MRSETEPELGVEDEELRGTSENSELKISASSELEMRNATKIQKFGTGNKEMDGVPRARSRRLGAGRSSGSEVRG